MMFGPRNDGLAGGGGRGAGRGARELGPVQLCRRRVSHSRPPPPAPAPAATRLSQPPEEHKAERGQPPRHPGARPRQGARGSAGGGEPRSQHSK